MTYLLTAAVILFFFQGCWSRAQFSPSVGCTSTDYEVNVSCLIINLDYVECNWTKPQMQHINYTFSSAFLWNSFSECPEYLQEQGQNVGCKIPLNATQRFEPFRTKLYVGGYQTICKNYTDLKQRVKLNPPSILSVNSSAREGEVCVRWIESKIKKNCVNYTVAYRKASGPWKISIPVMSSSYCVSPVASGVLYTFQVRSSMSDMCGASDFWSDWSDPVEWSNNKGVMTAEQPQVYWHVLGSVLGVIVLICLSLLLYYSERIRVVFVPVVPDPSKSLQDLFKKYNGNVESWVYINRELKDAFETDFTESPPCVVCEAGPTFETKTEDGPVEQPVS
ncbi:interleukin 2 receptor, gamma b [Ictalurus furcatus]|uniref:interleukin 2 receptor, gamma b n=1 Tax=Ictalurus furcatus TaxID=66913 RepID=UPI002350CFD9|nr:interleukin 2 receptor, gamma b [Ictalurus furcatus]